MIARHPWERQPETPAGDRGFGAGDTRFWLFDPWSAGVFGTPHRPRAPGGLVDRVTLVQGAGHQFRRRLVCSGTQRGQRNI